MRLVVAAPVVPFVVAAIIVGVEIEEIFIIMTNLLLHLRRLLVLELEALIVEIVSALHVDIVGN